MNTMSIEQLVEDMDRLIDEMVKLRSQVAALKKIEGQSGHSVREADYFGMWADREDLKDRSSREWLEDLRAAAHNPAFAFLNDSEEDIYTSADGEPFQTPDQFTR